MNKIICEYKNDVEVLFGVEGLTSWQIKSTTRNSVRPEDIYDSIRLFNSLNITGAYSQFVLVSNRNFARFNMGTLTRYTFDEFQDLRSKIQKKFDGKLEDSFLAKVRFLKGPEMDSIHSVISTELSCLYDRELVLNKMISFIDSIWNGLRYIAQFKIEDLERRRQQDIEFKTITLERIKKEILNDINQFVALDSESGSIDIDNLSEKISNADEEEIKYLINTYIRGSEFHHEVLKKFDDLSKTMKLYQSSSFMKFLRKISKNKDKNKIIAVFYILHNLIIMSKKHDHQIYSTFVADYKPLLSKAFNSLHGKYSYSQSKNILDSLDLSNDEWCELHWKRVKSATVAGITIEEIDKIYDNIIFVRNNSCKSLPQYRRYLGKKDVHIGVKKIIEGILISG